MILFSDLDIKISIGFGFSALVSTICIVLSETENNIIKEIKNLKNKD